MATVTSTQPKVLIFMADYGHDPTETAVPFSVFKDSGFEVRIATENGKSPRCDSRMLYGVTGKVLGASSKTVSLYESLLSDPAFTSPLSWSSPSFNLDTYSLVFLPGGHDKAVRQLLDSERVQKYLGSYFPATTKPSTKSLAAICHGVQVLAAASLPDTKTSVLHDVTTTALPGAMENGIFWATRLFLGDYYKTYGAGTDNVETIVRRRLDDAGKQWFGGLGTAPFVREDEKYNYVSGRFPPDAELLAKKAVELVRSVYHHGT